jgi:hypothetical protein
MMHANHFVYYYSSLRVTKAFGKQEYKTADQVYSELGLALARLRLSTAVNAAIETQ